MWRVENTRDNETTYPQTIPAVSAYPIPYHTVVAIEGNSLSPEKETPKEVNIENSRQKSYLYLDVNVIGD